VLAGGGWSRPPVLQPDNPTMTTSIFISDKLRTRAEQRSLIEFLQEVANRCCVGAARYEHGDGPDARKRYMTRMLKETEAYKDSGNKEQLLNVAVYCWLESVAPEHRRFHWDPKAKSVTRRES